MGDEFINGIARYCLWLVDCPPQSLRRMPEVLKLVEAVKVMRLASTKPPARSLASMPTLFAEIRQPKSNYLALPRASSERRLYIPIAYASEDLIAGDKLQTIANATLFEFGISTSSLHMAWMRTTAGRLKSGFQYSANITYNNFPWPDCRSGAIAANGVSDNRDEGVAPTIRVQSAAQADLDAHAVHTNASLTDLYDQLTMPATLLKAHQQLDKAVDAAYNLKCAASDAARMAFLFERY